jgi:hypothetical protein
MLHCPVIPPNGIDLEKCNCNVFIEINFESLSRKLVERKYCFKKMKVRGKSQGFLEDSLN